MRKQRRQSSEEAGLNMTPMIDMVFQLIIFFVCTVEMDRQSMDESIVLAMAPHGPPVEVKDPRTIYVDVNAQGRISISRRFMDVNFLRSLVRKAVAEYGANVPVVIEGDHRARHEDVRRVMDACAAEGLWRIRFAAVREKAGEASP